MELFIRHKLVETQDGTTILLYIDPNLTEFAQELGQNGQISTNKTLEDEVHNYIRRKLKPSIHAKLAKVMFGSLLIASIALTEQATSTYASGLSNSNYSKQQSENVKVILDGKFLSFPKAPVIRNGSTYIPIRSVAEAYGANVWWNGDSRTVGIEKGDKRIAFSVGSSLARVNGEQMPIPPSINLDGTVMVPIRFVSTALGLNVDWNNETRTVIINTPIIDQTLNAPNTNTIIQQHTTGTTSVSYRTHVIQKGDNMWDLSVKYGIPMQEFLKVNNMTQNSPLSVGQKINIPVHHIPVQQTVSEKHGEYLDWWTEAQYVYSIGKVAKVTDIQTGKTFMIKRTTGANHADNEPLTANDAAIIKQVWGGTYSWKTRPVLVEVDGRKIAASMSSMPHDVEYIKGENNFNGHFDIHFKNSTRHKDGLVDHDHQGKIKIAAGLASI